MACTTASAIRETIFICFYIFSFITALLRAMILLGLCRSTDFRMFYHGFPNAPDRVSIRNYRTFECFIADFQPIEIWFLIAKGRIFRHSRAGRMTAGKGRTTFSASRMSRAGTGENRLRYAMARKRRMQFDLSNTAPWRANTKKCHLHYCELQRNDGGKFKKYFLKRRKVRKIYFHS